MHQLRENLEHNSLQGVLLALQEQKNFCLTWYMSEIFCNTYGPAGESATVLSQSANSLVVSPVLCCSMVSLSLQSGLCLGIRMARLQLHQCLPLKCFRPGMTVDLCTDCWLTNGVIKRQQMRQSSISACSLERMAPLSSFPERMSSHKADL